MESKPYGRWGNAYRYQVATGEIVEGGSLEDFPTEKGFPDNVVAVMSGKGFLHFKDTFDFVPMMREYVNQIQERYCCGKCITGIKGSRVILVTLDKILRGESDESDLLLLARMADVLNDGAKCSVCQSAGELLKDGLIHYREHFLRAISEGKVDRGAVYRGAISAPCMSACPCHINIPGYVEMLQELRYGESLNIIRQEMPLPGVTGRICPAPCEKACSVANMGDVAIPIKTLKRVAADYEFIHGLDPPLEKGALTESPVAVIGAGPAGLSAAYYLNRLGHPVTMFEDYPASGGMVAVGIPPYRQPRDVLDREIKIICDLGVVLKQGVRFGRDMTIQDLFRQGFQAIFLGIGCHCSIPLGLELEDAGLKGVFPGGIDFLRDINLGKPLEIGHDVVIVGGGNTAIDCARTCVRMGAERVSIVYRRTEAEMPAEPEEVEDAREEGVIFHFLTQPVAILPEGGRTAGLRCLRMVLGEPDTSGRRRPIPVEGSEFDIEADTLIPAIGQRANVDCLKPEEGVEISRHGTIVIDPVTMMTSHPGVFAAGDAVSGPLTAVHALAGGKRAARMIHQYVASGTCVRSESQWMEDLVARIEKDRGVLVTARIPGRERVDNPRKKLDVQERIGSFREVDSGFTQKSSYIEASRCLRCFHLILAAVEPPIQ